MRRSILAVCVALLTVTAGCGGFVTGDGTPARRPYDVPPTGTQTATVTETETPSATPTETTTVASPQSSLAFRDAIDDHTSTLRDAGNFTVHRIRRIGRTGENVSPAGIETVLRVDLDADRYAVGVPSANGTDDGLEIRAYQNATGVYRRYSRDGKPAFRNVTGETAFTPRRAALSLVRYVYNQSIVFGFERNGTTTFDGERVIRFTATDPGPFQDLTRFENVTAFHATALVDTDGIVRKFTYTSRGRLYTNATVVEARTVLVTDVGNTTVTPPAALTNATDGS